MSKTKNIIGIIVLIIFLAAAGYILYSCNVKKIDFRRGQVVSIEYQGTLITDDQTIDNVFNVVKELNFRKQTKWNWNTWKYDSKADDYIKVYFNLQDGKRRYVGYSQSTKTADLGGDNTRNYAYGGEEMIDILDQYIEGVQNA